MLSVDRRYRYVYKPLVFAACLVPFLGIVGGILQLSGFTSVPGFNLGVDPVKQSLWSFGKTALNLLLITLTITPLRQITHNANLIRFRRMLGLFAFFYACMHFLDYIGPFQSFSWDAIVGDITKRPYITIGFAALVMLVPLAITSTNRMMRRLGRRWQKLHWLIYPIAILGVWHYWWSVKLDIREPFVYSLMLTALFGWRIWQRWRRLMARRQRAQAVPVRSAAPHGPPAHPGSAHPAMPQVTSKSALPRVQGKA